MVTLVKILVAFIKVMIAVLKFTDMSDLAKFASELESKYAL